jgi:hypothetical protein
MVSLSPCAQVLRECDPDLHACALFLPPEKREACLALLAFDATLAHIALSVREEMAGFVRFGWWRERLEGLRAGEVTPGHPVLEALHSMIQENSERIEGLTSILEARAAQFPPPPLKEMEDCVAWAASIYTPLFALCAQTLSFPLPSNLPQAWGMMHRARYQAGEATLKKELAARSLQLLPKLDASGLRPFAAAARWFAKRLEAGKPIGTPWERTRLLLYLAWI